MRLLLLLLLSTTAATAQTTYWQQEVNYTIDVLLNDESHQLYATESIEYTNNSPQSLTEIWFHLWPNAYKNNQTAVAKQLLENGEYKLQFATDTALGYIAGLEFKVNGQAVTVQYDEAYADMCRLVLNEPLLSGQTITITTPFVVKLPNSFSRLGHVGQSYQITQWYPKPAVYDKDGWHPISYLDQGEFYSEFGSFDVTITLPENYVVGATGDLQTKEELAWLTKLADSTAKIIEYDKSDMGFPPSSKKEKKIRYIQNNVHDFAWFADKRYHVLKGEVELPNSKRTVTTWAMFTNGYAKYWKNSLPYLNDATYYYSLWNGDYLYNQVTAVDGALSAGGGMEYPNITVIGKVGSNITLETVIMHEVGHNWFYGMLGNNERAHGWMDEGINTYNEQRYLQTKYPNTTLGESFGLPIKAFGLDKVKAAYNQNVLLYQLVARDNADQAIETPSAAFTPLNYGAIMYGKTGLVFRYLATYLGQDVFDKCMQTYFAEWKLKHPQPEDMQLIFERISGKNLDWFFNDLLKTSNKVDFKLSRARKEKEGLSVTLKNKTAFAAPAFVTAYDKRDSILATQQVAPFSGKSTVNFTQTDIKRVVIDPDGIIPEIATKNNTLQRGRLFPKIEPLSISLLGALERGDKRQLFILPIVGYNYNDGAMPGIALYNHLLPSKKLEWELLPMYGVKSKQLNGTGEIRYKWLPNSVFKTIELSGGFAKFSEFRTSVLLTDVAGNTIDKYSFISQFEKYQAQLSLQLRNKTARSPLKQHIVLRHIQVVNSGFLNDDPFWLDNSAITQKPDNYNELSYTIKNQRRLYPLEAKIDLQQHRDFLRTTAHFTQHFSYNKNKKKGSIQFFAGKYLYNNSSDARYRFYLSDNSDYLYDHALLDRSKISGKFQSKQLVNDDGGFKGFTTTPGSATYMVAINQKIPLPVLPLGVYGSQGFGGNGRYLTYEFGVYLPVASDIFEIYFPLNVSSDLSGLKYGERIRYIFHIEKLNPFDLFKKITE